MPYKNTYKDVSDYFLAFGNETGDFISNLRLQKLVYYAQAWNLANYDKPLFTDKFQAWVHGPVIPALYHECKVNGAKPLLSDLELDVVEQEFDEQTRELLQEVAEVYMAYTGYQLELMTHREDPWIIARKNLPEDASCSNVISNKSMRDYYAKKLQED